MSTTFHTIDEYIATFPVALQKKMQLLREIIANAAPDAIEKISWGMPTFYLHGNLVHFAAHQHHIGFYPGGHIYSSFADRLDGYPTTKTKSTIQIPHNKPIPQDVIEDIVRLRVKENAGITA